MPHDAAHDTRTGETTMNKYTHLTPAGATYSVGMKLNGRVKAMCGQTGKWASFWSAEDVALLQGARNMAPLCPKCAAALLIAETVTV
jgi:hypothetical protein